MQVEFIIFSMLHDGTLFNVMWQHGWEFGGIDTCICLTESLHCSPEYITTLFVNWLYFNTKRKKERERE